jgi:hypothetical protein
VNIYISLFALLFFGFVFGIVPLITLFSTGYLISAYTMLGLRGEITYTIQVLVLDLLTLPFYIAISILSLKIAFDWLMESARGNRKVVLNQTILEGVQKTSILAWPIMLIYLIDFSLF